MQDASPRAKRVSNKEQEREKKEKQTQTRTTEHRTAPFQKTPLTNLDNGKRLVLYFFEHLI
jgi:hypothetical protein